MAGDCVYGANIARSRQYGGNNITAALQGWQTGQTRRTTYQRNNNIKNGDKHKEGGWFSQNRRTCFRGGGGSCLRQDVPPLHPPLLRRRLRISAPLRITSMLDGIAEELCSSLCLPLFIILRRVFLIIFVLLSLPCAIDIFQVVLEDRDGGHGGRLTAGRHQRNK